MHREPDYQADVETPTRVFLRSGFVWRFCTAAYWTLFFIRVVVDVGLEPLELILLGTAKETTILLVEVPTGVVADLRSRRLSVIIAFVVCGVAVVAAALAESFTPLLITQVLWAFGSTFRSGAETAWYTDEAGSLSAVDAVLPRRARYESFGSIVGVLTTAVLAAFVGLSIALIAVGILLVSWGVFLQKGMPETGFRRVNISGLTRSRAILKEGFEASRRPALRVLLIATVLTGFASEAVDRLQIARLDKIGFPDSIDVALLIGAVVVVESAVSIVVLYAFGSRLAGQRFVAAAVTLHTITAIGVVVLAGANTLALALIGVLAAGTSRDVARTVTIGWTNHFTDKSNRATVHSFVGQAMSVGEIGGGVILGFLARQTGLSSALTASAAIYLTASLTARLGKPRWRKPRKNSKR